MKERKKEGRRGGREVKEITKKSTFQSETFFENDSKILNSYDIH